MLIGIDLGTTNSLAACFRNGRAELIANRLGSYMTPSVVSIMEGGMVLVGETAKEYGILHPLHTARVFKRSMGTAREFKLGDMDMSAEELSSLVLRSLKEDAEKQLGCEVDEAIISVPAYFNEFQRKATKTAGEMAGLKVLRIINEPTAAALAYGVGDGDKDERCLVFDLGGGTFDISILEFYKSIMEVHAVAGDNFLGGEDFTDVLVRIYLEKAGVTAAMLDVREMNLVKKAAEACKCEYAENPLPEMCCTIDGEEIAIVIPLMEYEKACEPLLERMRKPIERSIRDAGIKLSEIDRVILVGGATRLPIIRSFVQKVFHMTPDFIDPDTAIAVGAAITCGMKERDEEIREIIMTDVCPFTLGTEVSVDNGIFEEDGHYLPIIERNTVIPVSRTQTLYTAHENQKKIRVKILQGESRNAENNLKLGEIIVPVPEAPKGKESVVITYTYDVNSLLEVIVKVVSTGFTKKMIVQGGEVKISEEEAERRMERLAYLKQNPRDEEVNRLLLFKGERLYEETTGELRERINQALMKFERVLDRQDREEIAQARAELADFLNEVDDR